MSRIGKKIRKLPAGVTLEVLNGEIVVKGPKGTLKQSLHPRVTIINNAGSTINIPVY